MRELIINKESDINKFYYQLLYCDKVRLNISISDKKSLYLLGLIFGHGKKIEILNKEDVLKEVENYRINLNKPSKSFNLMAYAWERLGDHNFDIHSIQNEFDMVIENYKRLGVKPINYIKTEEKKGKIFLISPVRNANESQRLDLESHKKLFESEGYEILTPHINTVQTDMLGGYTICHQNAQALAESESIHIYYDKNSKGSMFDLGVADATMKPLILLNEESLENDLDDFGEKVVKEWNGMNPYEENEAIIKQVELIKKLKR